MIRACARRAGDRDEARAMALARDTAGDEEVRSVSGRLHLLDLEADRLGIRTGSALQWPCRYPEALEERVKSLLDRYRLDGGSGKLTSRFAARW